LSTGSNCCFYHGENIQLKAPAMGYLLMDEVSGSYFGKEQHQFITINKFLEYYGISVGIINEYILD
jgi:hypothetical protein